MRSPVRSTLLLTGTALVLLAVSACGGSATTDASTSAAAAAPSATASAGAAGGPGADFCAYRDCMSKNGVTLPDFGQRRDQSGSAPAGAPSGVPSGGPAGGAGGFPLPAGVDQATFDKAQAACASLRPQFGNRGFGQVDATALAAFKSCLTDHQVAVPAGNDFMRRLDRTDAKVSAALKTCAPLLPQPGAAGASATPAPTAS